MARTFVSGQKIKKLPTRQLNEAIEFAQQSELFGNRQDLLGLNRQFTISVRNDTVADDFDRFSCVGLDEALIDPDEGEIGFIANVNLSGLVPTFEHRSRFAICLEPIAPERIGKALLYGVTAAEVDITNLQHRFAQPKEGVAELQSVDFGGARILWPITPTSLGKQWCYVLLTGNGQATTGERISGHLITHLTSARTFTGAGREPGTALIQVFATDPANTLEAQNRNRYTITGVTPTDPADPAIIPAFEIDIDVRYRLVPHYPIQIVESTGRDGTYRVLTVEWDDVAGTCTIEVEQPIAEVLDPNPPHDPIVDGTILIPGGDRRIPTERYEIVETLANRAGRAGAWCEATHDGNAFNVTYVDC